VRDRHAFADQGDANELKDRPGGERKRVLRCAIRSTRCAALLRADAAGALGEVTGWRAGVLRETLRTC
jgi:hypothetical protein